jgi:hypothetical protein
MTFTYLVMLLFVIVADEVVSWAEIHQEVHSFKDE